MSNNTSIMISDFLGIFKAIAEKANKNGNETLEGDEISIFYNTKNTIQTLSNQQSIFFFEDKMYDSTGRECSNLPIVAVNDAIPEKDSYWTPVEAEYKTKQAQYKNKKALELVESYVKNAQNTENINYKNHPKYRYVKDTVTYQLLKRLQVSAKNGVKSLDGIKDPSQRKELSIKAEYITKIVLEKCDKYEISDLAPVIADMLGNETDGYNFSDSVLSNPGKQYKGVMQVDFETCCSIFGERSNAKINAGVNKKTGKTKIVSAKKSDEVYKAWHKAHFSHDDSRINELKLKYKTPDGLYAAIQKDVELGIEVGIIAYKAKLHEKEGNVKSAVITYSGSSYGTNVKGVPTTFKIS